MFQMVAKWLDLFRSPGTRRELNSLQPYTRSLNLGFGWHVESRMATKVRQGDISVAPTPTQVATMKITHGPRKLEMLLSTFWMGEKM